MNKDLHKLFVEQINHEFFSAYLYLELADVMEATEYQGMAKWLRAQVKEEISHAIYLRSHLIDRNMEVSLLPIDSPKNSAKTPLEVFKAALDHEKVITKNINDMADKALEVKDHGAFSFLGWFVDEQIEEEANFSAVVGRLENIADNSAALYNYDAELAARVFLDGTPIAGQF